MRKNAKNVSHSIKFTRKSTRRHLIHMLKTRRVFTTEVADPFITRRFTEPLQSFNAVSETTKCVFHLTTSIPILVLCAYTRETVKKLPVEYQNSHDDGIFALFFAIFGRLPTSLWHIFT